MLFRSLSFLKSTTAPPSGQLVIWEAVVRGGAKEEEGQGEEQGELGRGQARERVEAEQKSQSSVT